MPRNNDHALTVRLPTALYEQVKALADAEERTVAWLLRRLAREHVAGVAARAPGRSSADLERGQ